MANLVLYFIFVICNAFCPLGFFFNFVRSDLYSFWKTIPKRNVCLYYRIFLTYFIIVIKLAGERVLGDLLIRDEDNDVLRSSDDICLRIDSDPSVEVATERVFVVEHIYLLDVLRQLTKYFGLA